MVDPDHVSQAVVIDTMNPEGGILFEKNPQDEGRMTSQFLIVNNSESRNVAFKIKTTAPLCYVVKPNSGIINAKQSQRLHILYVHNDVSIPISSVASANTFHFTDQQGPLVE